MPSQIDKDIFKWFLHELFWPSVNVVNAIFHEVSLFRLLCMLFYSKIHQFLFYSNNIAKRKHKRVLHSITVIYCTKCSLHLKIIGMNGRYSTLYELKHCCKSSGQQDLWKVNEKCMPNGVRISFMHIIAIILHLWWHKSKHWTS